MASGGIVYLVGAGPGDAELITVKGLKRLQAAGVVVYDRLIPDGLLDQAPRDAGRIAVGKAPGHQPWPQQRINKLLVAEARRGRNVVRLKGGDPFVFGRGGEECEALAAAGIPFEIVPGVTSAVAAPAFAGIPLTHRDHVSSFAVVTGHQADGVSPVDWSALSRVGTLVVMMGLRSLGRIVAQLRENGRDANTPAVAIGNAASPRQVVVRGTLDDIVARTRGMRTPVTVVIGEVARLSDRLAWFRDGTQETPAPPMRVAREAS
jgi:uroporphyrin-III C-methyltransferase